MTPTFIMNASDFTMFTLRANQSSRNVLVRWSIVLIALSACSDPKVVADVGSVRITLADVQLQRATSKSNGERVSTEVLDTLIRRELLAEGARQTGLIDDAVRARLAAAERDILAQAYLDKRLTGASTDDAVRRRYETQPEKYTRHIVHVQQVIVRVPPGATEDFVRAAETRAHLANAQLQSGRSFSEIVREFSDDSTSEAGDGELPRFSENETDAAFFDAAVALHKGETSPVVRTPFGFHVIRAVDDVRQVQVPFEQVRGRILAEVRQEEEARLLEGLRRKITVKVHSERLEGQSKK